MFEKSSVRPMRTSQNPREHAAAARQVGDAAARENLEKAAECLPHLEVLHLRGVWLGRRLKFQDSFHDKIAQLVFTFPEDATTSTGSLVRAQEVPPRAQLQHR